MVAMTNCSRLRLIDALTLHNLPESRMSAREEIWCRTSHCGHKRAMKKERVKTDSLKKLKRILAPDRSLAPDEP